MRVYFHYHVWVQVRLECLLFPGLTYYYAAIYSTEWAEQISCCLKCKVSLNVKRVEVGKWIIYTRSVLSCKIIFETFYAGFMTGLHSDKYASHLFILLFHMRIKPLRWNGFNYNNLYLKQSFNTRSVKLESVHLIRAHLKN